MKTTQNQIESSRYDSSNCEMELIPDTNTISNPHITLVDVFCHAETLLRNGENSSIVIYADANQSARPKKGKKPLIIETTSGESIIRVNNVREDV